MPCFFCIAAVALIAGSSVPAAIEGIKAGLDQLAKNGVATTDDTPSTERLELEVAVPRLTPEISGRRRGDAQPPMQVPVAVTIYKKHARVRVQVLTHDVNKAEAEAVQDLVVRAAGLELVHRSQDHEQHVVHEAVDRLSNPEPELGGMRAALQEES